MSSTSLSKKIFISKENENILGVSVKCQHKNCGAYTLISHCPHCNTKAIYSEFKNDYIEGEKIKCPNKECQKEYDFKKNNELYRNYLTVLEPIEGSVINFGIAEVDENFLYKENLFTDKRILKNSRLYPTQYSSEFELEQKSTSNSKSFEECMICHNNRKESIFFPCGHRCACYNCAVIYFEVFQKCPKCLRESKCIIKKVYD